MQVLKLPVKKATVVYAGAMWDGERARLRRRVSVVISGDRIVRILEEASPDNLKLSFPEARAISLPSLTLLPGLVDCHIHLAMDGHNFQASLQGWGNRAALRQRIACDLQETLRHGITAVRDGGDLRRIGLWARNLVRHGKLEGPTVVATGQALGRHGMYGSFLGPGVTGTGEALGLIRNLYRQGVDQVKVVASGIVSLSHFGKVGPLHFPDADLKKIVQAAHSYGLKVMAHASSDQAVRACIRAGVDSIEHGYFASSATLAAMADTPTWWVPTLIPVAVRDDYPGCDPDVVRRTWQLHLQKVAEAHRLGVNLAVGTDAGSPGVPHGGRYLDELRLLSQAGLPSLDLLRAATMNGARLLGLEQDIGTLATGKKALIIGVAGNPLENLDTLSNIHFLAY